MLSKKFKARVNKLSRQVGIKEEFKVILNENRYEVSLVFCLDRDCHFTVPAVYTKNGFAPLRKALDINDQDVVSSFMSSRHGIYSILGYVQLICVVKGKLKDFNWEDVRVEYYIPGGLSGDEIYAEKASGVGLSNCHPFPAESLVTDTVLTYLLTVLPSKDKFYISRCK